MSILEDLKDTIYKEAETKAEKKLNDNLKGTAAVPLAYGGLIGLPTAMVDAHKYSTTKKPFTSPVGDVGITVDMKEPGLGNGKIPGLAFLQGDAVRPGAVHMDPNIAAKYLVPLANYGPTALAAGVGAGYLAHDYANKDRPKTNKERLVEGTVLGGAAGVSIGNMVGRAAGPAYEMYKNRDLFGLMRNMDALEHMNPEEAEQLVMRLHQLEKDIAASNAPTRRMGRGLVGSAVIGGLAAGGTGLSTYIQNKQLLPQQEKTAATSNVEGFLRSIPTTQTQQYYEDLGYKAPTGKRSDVNMLAYIDTTMPEGKLSTDMDSAYTQDLINYTKQRYPNKVGRIDRRLSKSMSVEEAEQSKARLVSTGFGALLGGGAAAGAGMYSQGGLFSTPKDPPVERVTINANGQVFTEAEGAFKQPIGRRILSSIKRAPGKAVKNPVVLGTAAGALGMGTLVYETYPQGRAQRDVQRAHNYLEAVNARNSPGRAATTVIGGVLGGYAGGLGSAILAGTNPEFVVKHPAAAVALPVGGILAGGALGNILGKESQEEDYTDLIKVAGEYILGV